MAFSSQDSDSSNVVGAVDKHPHVSSPVSGEQAEPAQPEIRFDLAAIKRVMPDDNSSGGLFQSKSWYTPPPPPPVAAAKVAPVQTAPALPFTYIGKMQDGNEVVLFLSGNGKNYTVKAGDMLDSSYRVEKIDENNAVLTYLPMDVQQTLVFNANSGKAAYSPTASAAVVAVSPFPQSIAQVH